MSENGNIIKENSYIPNIKELKNELRAKFLEQRASMPEQMKKELDSKIASKFLNSVSYRHANTLLCYFSSPSELDTHEIINAALRDGKKVALPRCNPQSLNMDFHFITSFDDLEKTTPMLYEPKADLPKFDCEQSLSICIIPAVVFDKSGYRIGYGKGYYDRFLNKFSGAQIGIIYSSCIAEKLPRGRYDCAVDVLITEKGIQALKV